MEQRQKEEQEAQKKFAKRQNRARAALLQNAELAAEADEFLQQRELQRVFQPDKPE